MHLYYVIGLSHYDLRSKGTETLYFVHFVFTKYVHLYRKIIKEMRTQNKKYGKENKKTSGNWWKYVKTSGFKQLY